MHRAFRKNPDTENIVPDATIIRAHPCTAGAPKARGDQDPQALRRIRGGFSTKIHVVVDGLGNLLRTILTPGQHATITQGPNLLRGFEPKSVPADKGYDSKTFVELI